MKSICFYFQVHQPYRVDNFNFFDAYHKEEYFTGPEENSNYDIFQKVANKCYLPMTNLLLRLLDNHPEFHISFSLSGVFIDQCEEYGEIGEKVLDNFKALAATDRVEFLSETYYHSLAFLYSKQEFAEQIEKHRKKIYELFKQKTTIYRNTELIYSNEIAAFINEMGFKAILAEGWDHVLKGGNPHDVMKAVSSGLHEADRKIAKQYAITKRKPKELKVLLKDYNLSDDIAFRFGNKEWEEYPLSCEKYVNWVEQAYGETINLFMDFETFGEHQWEDTGIFSFIEALPAQMIQKGIGFKTPSQTISSYETRDTFDCHHYLSWADTERNLSAWVDNELQRSTLEELNKIEKLTHKLKNHKNPETEKLIEQFRRLQTSDHLYYMSTKYWGDGDVHAYFSPYESPYKAFTNFMNVLHSIKKRVLKLAGD